MSHFDRINVYIYEILDCFYTNSIIREIESKTSLNVFKEQLFEAVFGSDSCTSDTVVDVSHVCFIDDAVVCRNSSVVSLGSPNILNRMLSSVYFYMDKS